MPKVATTHERERELYREIADVLSTALPAVELLAVELLGPDRFCVFIDHADGVDHALCGEVTTALGDYLEEFTIDVSSPGLERPLRDPAHFEAALGQRVAVRLAAATNGRRKFRGRIARTTDSHVSLELDEGETDVAYDQIARANLIYEGRST
ncbi:MAG: ribosome maturation factor RimP [Gaiellaceae bacterium]